MVPNILPTDPLSQVVFVHNYLQLVFQDSGFTIYNPCALNLEGTPIQFGQDGFADALVGLIGQSLLNAASFGEESLSHLIAKRANN